MKTTSPQSLGAPVSVLHGVGSRIAEKLNRLGLFTVRELLFHLPLRYIDRTRLVPVGALRHGQYGLVQGTIELAQIGYGKRRSLLCRMSDGTGALTLRFFHFTKSQQDGLKRGMQIRCYGQARFGVHSLEMIHPEYQVFPPDHSEPVEDTLTPVYPTTAGLHQAKLRSLAAQALGILERTPAGLNELLPEAVRKKFHLPALAEAIVFVHHPPPGADTRQLLDGVHPAQQRLAFEELLAQVLSLRQLRQQLRGHEAAPLAGEGRLTAAFLHRLPFTLTPAQAKAAREIRADLKHAVPMLRLLQGDVGSGKTVVAALAALQAIEAGGQAGLMAPTELLAEQHYTTFRDWFSDLAIPVVLLTGKSGKAERKKIAELLASPRPCLAIGTHALFQEDVDFACLRLVIIDEQHRFGVHQRLAFLGKGQQGRFLPHQLIMTATPIPRTLAMTVYADLDISVIDTLPPGRKPVTTAVIPTARREEVIDRIRQACRLGRQAYWVCTLIEESEVLQCETAIDTFQTLSEKLPGIRVGLVHGRMKNSEKDGVMKKFRDGEIQLLVATTVIEVGVDVPNASLMIIENAERFGLFQLHQLRGRIGRGASRSDCVLLYQPPLGETARIRLDTVRNTSNGFRIARKDLELRGPGELMGTRQAGIPELRIANLVRDAKLLPAIHSAAGLLLRQYPDRVQPLIDRWCGKDVSYGKV